jgi:rhodanese-related sulfurtransferase
MKFVYPAGCEEAGEPLDVSTNPDGESVVFVDVRRPQETAMETVPQAF